VSGQASPRSAEETERSTGAAAVVVVVATSSPPDPPEHPAASTSTTARTAARRMSCIGSARGRTTDGGPRRQLTAFLTIVRIFASTSRSASSLLFAALSSWARSLIAARSSAVNPLADLGAPFFAVFVSAMLVHLLFRSAAGRELDPLIVGAVGTARAPQRVAP